MLDDLVGRLFGVARNRDGWAHAFDDLAEIETAAEDQAPSASTRRHRPVAHPKTIILESLSQKVLHAWLQNRHQTLYPLTMTFRNLAPEHVELLVQAMAAAMLADGTPEPREADQAGRALASAGAGERERVVLENALENPIALSTLLRQIQDANLGVHAYAASVVAVNQRSLANRLYLEYLAARLAIPGEVVSSLNRRYRR